LSSVLGVASVAGCASDSGDGPQPTERSGTVGKSSTTDREVTFLLTPDNPSRVRDRYRPIKRYLEDIVSNLTLSLEVPDSYSEILPTLRSGDAELANDDVSLIAGPDLFEVIGTAVTRGTGYYFSMVLVRNDESASFPDVSDERVAFADPLSTSGSVYPLYDIQAAGIDIGSAPFGDPVDFEGSWTNHETAISKLVNGDADYCATWDGNGVRYVSPDSLPERVSDQSAYAHDAGSEEPRLSAVFWSPPIPKQPVYTRADWTSPVRAEISEALYSASRERILRYAGGHDVTLPFASLAETSISEYEPVIQRVKALGLDLRSERG
jgi:phosphonate transport system substrate-binding protein